MSNEELTTPLTPRPRNSELASTAISMQGTSEDVAIIVTLDQLLPYDRDPRKVRNPRYEEIKASIKARGLDAPPVITSRPGETIYRIRNGGNTRLSILRELWAETKDERFFRIPCLFRPWPERGEIILLTGHLVENQARGKLSFIERALGIEEASQLYEQEIGKPLSQSELARRLTADGYPTQQSHVSRMREAVEYLLPAIPRMLFAGLGRHQVEKLVVLRKAAERIWTQHSDQRRDLSECTDLYQEALAQLDGEPSGFCLKRFQDELIGKMAQALGVDYDTLAFDLRTHEARQAALRSDPTSPGQSHPLPPSVTPPEPTEPSTDRPTCLASELAATTVPGSPSDDSAVAPAHPPRLDTVTQLVNNHTGQFAAATSDSVDDLLSAWAIPPELDEVPALRTQIAQVADELALNQGIHLESVADDLGYACERHESSLPLESLLVALATGDAIPVSLRALLLGGPSAEQSAERLTDLEFIKLFRLIRLARRLQELNVD